MITFEGLGWVFVASGALAVGGGALNLDAFMNHKTAEPFVNALGRTGARVFYVLLGLVVMALGGLMASWCRTAGL